MREDLKKARFIHKALWLVDIIFIVTTVAMWVLLRETPDAVRQFLPSALTIDFVLVVLTMLTKIICNTLGDLVKGMGYKDL